MEINEYQKLSKRTLATLGDSFLDELHMVMGLSTESGELTDAYKRHMAYGKVLDDVNVKEELGDQMFYIANLCNLKGWDLRDILATNVKKLQTRFPDKFSEDNANTRNLEAERKILEQ